MSLLERLKSRLVSYPENRDDAFLRSLKHLYATDRRWRKRGAKTGLPLGTYMEFGVWNGVSMEMFWRTLGLMSGGVRKDWKLWGFDSFEGLPDPVGAADAHPFAGKGAFRSTGQQQVEQRLSRVGIPLDRFELVPGFFEKSLTPELKRRIGSTKVCFANVDVDFYSSTKTALDWIEDLLFDGSIVYFDDISFYNGNPKKGQIRAIREFNEARTSSGLHQERGLDPWGRIHIYWRDEDRSAENLRF
jgi:O-methyltransferase